MKKIPINSEEGMTIIKSVMSLEFSANLQNFADRYVNDYVYKDLYDSPMCHKGDYTLSIIQKIKHKVKPIMPNKCHLIVSTCDLDNLISKVDLSLDLQFRFTVVRIVKYNLESGQPFTTFLPPDRLWFTHPDLFDYKWHKGVDE